MQYTNKAEIHEFHILNLLDYNSNSFNFTAYYAANSAANSAAHSTAYHAADSTAYSAARRNQVDIIKNLLEGVE